MAIYDYTAPCHFGLEAVLKREITDLGLEVTGADDGRVFFRGDENTAALANVNLRTAERVLLDMGSFEARSFTELFDETKKIRWEDFFPEDAKFYVSKVSSIKSALHSPSDTQSIMKKAMVEGMKERTGRKIFPETGATFPLRVSIKKDVVSIGLDTTGASLHKRGYRVEPVIAPISETLAADIIMLSPWRPDRILVDPFCGSGTIPIEAAMIAADIAPGMRRKFLAESWDAIVPRASFKEARDAAKARVKKDITGVQIQGYDIDGRAVAFSRKNAAAAGVADLIHFQERPVSALSHPKKYGFVITNPPYGERIEDAETMPRLYTEIGEAYRRLDSWSMFIITSYDDAQKYIGRKADKNRKIYNGMIRTYLYQYMGPKPPRRGGQGPERSERA